MKLLFAGIGITLFFLISCNQLPNKYVFANDPLAKAKSMIVEKKYDLAIEQYKKAINTQPNNILSIADSCYAEASKLLKNGHRTEAKKLFDYACNVLQSHSQSFTENFYTYLELINDNDSIFSIIIKLYPNYSDWNLKSQLMKTNLSCLTTFIGNMFLTKDGYCDDLWLFPTGNAEFNKKYFGISSFNPIVSNAITRIEPSAINSITSKAIIRSIKEDQLFLTENWAVGLRISAIPELNELFAPLKDKTDFQIAAETDRIVNGIKSFREKYLLANLKYIFTKYRIKGYCYIYKKNYDFNSKQIDLHLSISNQTNEGIYIGTVRVPLSLEDAQIIFENEEGYKADVFYKVSPGIEYKGLGISGGGVSRWGMPNLYMIEEPVLSIDFPKKSFKFRTNGLKGELWTGVDTERWDLNKENQPFSGGGGGNYGQLIRIIKGFNLSEIQEGENFLTDSSQSFLKYQGTYLVKADNTFDEGKLVFKVSDSKLIGLCEQGVNPMGGLAKRKYEATAIDSNGSGNYIYSYAIYNRQGELLQENKAAAKGKIYFMNDRVKIGDEIFIKMK